MNARMGVLFAFAAAITLTSAAAAGPDAAKQRVAIDAKILPQGKFELTPLQSGALKPDSGTVSGNWRGIVGRDVMRDGQKVTIYNGVWTLTGKRGTSRFESGTSGSTPAATETATAAGRASRSAPGTCPWHGRVCAYRR